MDNDALKKGESYHKLRKSYIIFICMFDPFGLNLPKYTFTAHCDEHLDLKLDDGATRIFLNCYGNRHKTTKALANLLDYISDGIIPDEYTNMIDKEVVDFREDNGKKRLFMTYQQTIMEERMFAREEGRVEGMFSALAGLVRDNILPIKVAAQRAGLTEEAFSEKMKEAYH